MSMFHCPTPSPRGEFFEDAQFYVTTDYKDGYYLFAQFKNAPQEAKAVNWIVS